MKREFFWTAIGIASFGALCTLFRVVPLPNAYLFIPALLLATSLCEVAIGILATVLLDRTRTRAYFPLAVTAFGCALINLAMFIAVPLPGTGAPLIVVYEHAAPWLHSLFCVAFASGSVWYAVDRARRVSLTAATTRRLLLVGLPAAVVLVLLATVALVRAVPRLPALFHIEDVSSYRITEVGYSDLLFLTVALIVLATLLRTNLERIDFAMILAVLAAMSGAVLRLVSDHRIDLSWFAMRFFFLGSAAVVLTAIVRQLLDGLTDKLRLESELLRAEASAFEQNAAVEASLIKSRFVAAVSHELRTPLGGIMGMAELLERTHLTDHQRMCTAAIRASADTLLHIVNDLLDFSRVDAGMLQLEDVTFELAPLVDEVVFIFREQARQKGVVLSAFIAPTLPTAISGDPTRIKQVLQNLVNNAVRFTSEGSIRIEVAKERWAGGAPMLAFTVRDTGIGIAESAHERIFDAFTQEDASTARRFGGTGLGLAIARYLVELMGGRIWVRSTVGVGSTFAFSIPLRTVCTNVEKAMPLRDMRILVVERDPAIRDLLQRYVAGWEMLAQTVGSPDEARAIAAQHAEGDRPCAVLLVGPGIPPDEATALSNTLRSSPMLAEADRVYISNDEYHDGTCPEGFNACVAGALRQSTLFDTLARNLIERKAEVLAGAAPRRPRRERILVAEDNEINQTLLVAQLEHLGFRATLAGDGEAAIEATKTERFDLIFMDCQMPGIDGFEAARRIRAGASPCRDVPIVAVTANVLPGYRDICLAAGMSDYLAKPALIEPLSRIVDHWLPLSGDPPDLAVPEVPESVGTAIVDVEEQPEIDIRKRLREIFRGDDARVEATITMALASLRDGTIALQASMVAHDHATASRTAHKLKGIAMEIGLVEIADLARRLEEHLKAGDWPSVDTTFVRFTGAIAAEAAQSEETMK
jgi:signal transduction histidine kinase/CheY-like chemotaxis protein